MQLKILNGSLQSIVEYLPKLQLKGRENRARQKLLKKVTDKFQEFYSDVQEIKSEHPDDVEKQNEELSELLKEGVIVDMTEYANLMPKLYDAMFDYPHEIDTERTQGKPSDSAIHDYIIDILEQDDAPHVETSSTTDAEADYEEAQYQEVE